MLTVSMTSLDGHKRKTKEEPGSKSTLGHRKSRTGHLLVACMKLADLSAIFGKGEPVSLWQPYKKTVSRIVLFFFFLVNTENNTH